MPARKSAAYELEQHHSLLQSEEALPFLYHIFLFWQALLHNQKDVEEGILDEKKALELLECLWVKFNNQPAPPKVGITLKESSTYTDFANLNTGGVFLLICTLELGCSSFISSMQS